MKAEAARCGKDGSSLAAALGRNPKYVYDRFSFKKAFSTRDLGKIAEFLGITIQDIIRSAAFDAQIHAKEVA
ncbi:hypothetical protein ACR74E_03940 [Bifidobacterium longum subsp. longum]|uniref:hypothetical protein n=1 Tax=Bifidobacterium longum TaxID=216816 RepID=UPI003DA56A0E